MIPWVHPMNHVQVRVLLSFVVVWHRLVLPISFIVISLLWDNHIINSLVPGRCGGNLKSAISKHMSWISSWVPLVKLVPGEWMPKNTFDLKSTLVQVMVWCCQVISHYLSQWCPRSVSPNLSYEVFFVLWKFLHWQDISSILNFVVSMTSPGLILGLRPANDRPCYFVTLSLIG